MNFSDYWLLWQQLLNLEQKQALHWTISCDGSVSKTRTKAVNECWYAKQNWNTAFRAESVSLINLGGLFVLLLLIALKWALILWSWEHLRAFSLCLHYKHFDSGRQKPCCLYASLSLSLSTTGQSRWPPIERRGLLPGFLPLNDSICNFTQIYWGVWS